MTKMIWSTGSEEVDVVDWSGNVDDLIGTSMNAVLVRRSTIGRSEKGGLVDRRKKDKMGNIEELPLIYRGLAACAHANTRTWWQIDTRIITTWAFDLITQLRQPEFKCYKHNIIIQKSFDFCHRRVCVCVPPILWGVGVRRYSSGLLTFRPNRKSHAIKILRPSTFPLSQTQLR
jgi:hypothetical protein